MAAIAPDGPPAPLPAPAPPLSGLTLRVRCEDPAFAANVRGRAAGWTGRTGATVAVTEAPQLPDVAIVRAAEVGALAAADELAVLPAALRLPDHPLQWLRVLPAYRTPLSVWGRDTIGVPLSGDASVLAYRADLFADETHRAAFRVKFGRELAPPATWDDVALVGRYFFEATGKPSLAPLPVDPDRLLTLFHQLAVPADRRAVTEGEIAKSGRVVNVSDSLSVHFDTETASPRIDAPGFARAAKWLAETRPLRPAGEGPAVAALAEGSAVLAVLPLRDLVQLPRENGAVAGRFGVARLPGSAVVYGPGGAPEPATGAANYVPYFGERAMVAVVFKRGANPDAAWDFVADLAGVAGGLAAMGDPTVAAGPFRGEEVEDARATVWLPYGFDAARTAALGDAVRGFLALEVANPATVLRTPNQGELMGVLERHVRRAATGHIPPESAVRNAAIEWADLTAKTPGFREQLRASVGLK